MNKLSTVLDLLCRRTRLDNKTGCWLIDTGLDRDGYTRVYFMGTSIRVNRVSAHIFLGLDIKDRTKQANHIRECPNRNCWNPTHLYIGSQSDNRIDSFMLGQSVMFGGHSHRTNEDGDTD